MSYYDPSLRTSHANHAYLLGKQVIERFAPPEFAQIIKNIPYAHQSMHSLDMAFTMEVMGHVLGGDYKKFLDTLHPGGRSLAGIIYHQISQATGTSYLNTSFSDDELRKKYNGKLVTFAHEDGNEKLAETKPDELSSLFRPGHEQDWPQLVLTSNHALARDESDLSDIMHGFLHLIGSATGLPHAIESLTNEEMHQLAEHQAKPANGHALPFEAKDKVVIAAAHHSERNTLLSGAKLIRRIETLSRIWEKDTGHKVHQLPPTNPFGLAKQAYDQFMRDYLGKQDDPWNHMSPAAMVLAKNILTLLMSPDDQARIYDPQATGKLYNHYTQTMRNCQGEAIDRPGDSPRWMTLNYEAGMPAQPGFALRRDAEKVAQHIHLMGYSRGGNTVTDAMRFVVHELQELSKSGKLYREGRYDGNLPSKVTNDEIAGIIKNISLLSVAAGEIPLSERETKAGMRRVNIISDKDLIAGHFTAGFPPSAHTGDDLYEVDNGTTSNLGHDPVEALGGTHYDKRTGARKTIEGYMAKDPTVRDALRTMFMPMRGFASISDIEPLESNGGEHVRLIVRSAAGSTEQHVENIRRFLLEKLQAAPGGEEVTIDHANHSTSLIIGGLHRGNSVSVLHALEDALSELDTPSHPHGITIYNRVLTDVRKEREHLEEQGISGAGIKNKNAARAGKGSHVSRLHRQRTAAEEAAIAARI